MDTQRWLAAALAAVEDWQASFGPFEPHASTQISDEDFGAAFADFAERLRDNYPYFHPEYAGQMLKPPHPAAVVGYLTAMLINPNNHSLDAGPASAAMEKECVAQLATMFGYDEYLGHLTTSGTIANLEALFVAREEHPDKGIAYSEDAHYTHSRMCRVLGMKSVEVPVDDRGCMRPDALDAVLKRGETGTVVLTLGSTGLGAIDPVHELLPVARKYGVRVHVDTAYGGFFTLLAKPDSPEPIDPAPWNALPDVDSIVVDPHKHGLQPYGCGAVLFRDPHVGRFYVHDSPYTYYTSDDLHLGQISLECSRAGASAAALWLTFKLIPPTPSGLGEVLAGGRRAAVRWANLINESELLTLYQEPELDILVYFPTVAAGEDGKRHMSAIDAASAHVLKDGMTREQGKVYLSELFVSDHGMHGRYPDVVADVDHAHILRSVLMKPESETYLDELHARMEDLARAAIG